MDNETFIRIRSTLITLPQAVGELLAEHGHQPRGGSQADREYSAYPGTEAVRTTYTQAMLEITAAADHMAALERTLTSPVMTFALWTVAREVLEAASLAAWLLDTNLQPVTRVARGMTVRLRHLEAQETYARATLERNPEASADLGIVGPRVKQRIESLKEQAKERGIVEKVGSKGRTIGFGEVLPSATNLAELAFNEGATYRLLSAIVHGRTWARLAVGLRRVEIIGIKAVEQHLTPEAALFLITSSIVWFTRPTWAYFKLNGWDLRKLASILELQYNQAALNEDTRFWRLHIMG